MADADRRDVGVHHAVALHDVRIYIIYIRGFDGPQTGVLHRQLHGRGALLLPGQAGDGGVAHHAAHRAAFFVLQRMLQPIVCGSQPVVFHRGLDVQHGPGEIACCGKVRMDEGAERNHMHRGRLAEPDMPVNAPALVEPAFFQRGVGTDAKQVLAAVVQILRDVIHLRGIAAGLVPQVETVDPHAGVAEDAVELQPEMLAQVLLRNGEGLAIPAHAGLGILISHCFIAVAMAGFGRKRQVHHPVVRQVYRLPRRRVELFGIRPGVVDGRRLRQIVEILGAAPEVLLRRSGVA